MLPARKTALALSAVLVVVWAAGGCGPASRFRREAGERSLIDFASHDIGSWRSAGRRIAIRAAEPPGATGRPALRIRMGHPGDMLYTLFDPVDTAGFNALRIDALAPSGNRGEVSISLRDGDGLWRRFAHPMKLPGDGLPFDFEFDTLMDGGPASVVAPRRVTGLRLTLDAGEDVWFYLAGAALAPRRAPTAPPEHERPSRSGQLQ